MDVRYAFLCERAEFDDDTYGLDIDGIFDATVQPELPAELVDLTVVIRLDFTIEEAWREHEIRLVFRDPDLRVLDETGAKFVLSEIATENPASWLIRPVSVIRLKTWGRHQIAIPLDGVEKHVAPLDVLHVEGDGGL